MGSPGHGGLLLGPSQPPVVEVGDGPVPLLASRVPDLGAHLGGQPGPGGREDRGEVVEEQ